MANNNITLTLGRVPKERGVYSSSSHYYKDNIVEYQGSAYIAAPTSSVNDGNDGTQDSPEYYLTRAPFASDPSTPNNGWRVFANGRHTFSTGEEIGNVGIDSEPVAGSTKLVESGGVKKYIDESISPLAQTVETPAELVVYTRLQSLRVDRNSNKIVTANAAPYQIAYINIPSDTDYYKLYITSKDVVDYSNIQVIGYSESVPANDVEYIPVDYTRFSNSDTTYNKELFISEDIRGKYVIISTHNNIPITIKASKLIDVNVELQNLATNIEEVKDDFIVTEITELESSKVTKLRVNDDHNAFATAGATQFIVKYILIPNDVSYNEISVSSVDNYDNKYLQYIGISDNIPANGVSTVQLDYLRFHATGDTYTKNIEITEGYKGKYLVVGTHENNNTTIKGVTKTKTTSQQLQERVNELDEQVEVLNKKGSVSKIFNPKIDFKRAELRVLDIGNSFTNGAVNYLPNLISAAGIDLSNIAHCVAYRGSASFKSWYNCYHDNDTEAYTITKTFGNLAVDLTGSHGSGNGQLFRNVLSNNVFDIILIHQASAYSGNYSIWEGNGNGGYLKEFIRLIRTKQPSASIGYLFTHSNPNGNPDVNAFYENIAESVKWIASNYDIDFIIPYGTAIQNIRQSVINTSTHYLTKDGKHIAPGLAQYVAACVYFQSLISPRYGVSVYGNEYVHTVTESEKNGVDTEHLNDCIDVTSENAPIAQMAAIIACNDFYSVQNPDGISL